MNYNLELQKIELKLKEVSVIEDRIKLLKEAIKISDANNDIEWGFDFRLNLIAEEVSTSKCADSFSAFSWILDTWENNQNIFEENEFLWEYKWMANASYRNVNISREQIESILEDLKVRMERNGYSLRGYYSIVIAWNQFLGKIDEAEYFVNLREKEQRDDMSHCPACELDTQVELKLRKGEFDEALTLAYDLINGKLTCAHIPFVTFSQLSYFMNKARDPRAAEYFEKALKELGKIDKSDSSVLPTISILINYLIDKDKEKAFSFFEKYVPWEQEAEDSIRYTFSKNILRLFSGTEERKLYLTSGHPLYKPDHIYPLQDLYIYYYNQSLDLAQKFDQRNGTSLFVDNLQKEIR